MNDKNTNDEHQASKLSLQLDQLTDNELLVLFVDRKSEAAFNELVKRHSRMVFGICRSVVSSQDCAEDAFQATFLALVRNAKRLRTATSFSGWLCRVARRAAIKASILQRSRESQSDNIDYIEPTIELDPLNQLAAREVVQSLAEELESIPKRFKEVLILFYFESLSRSEIANRMDCTEMAVISLLQRGKRLLRTRLLRKGVVPAMIVLSLQSVGRYAQAYDCAALISKTTATCAAGLSATPTSVPVKLSKLSKAGEWQLLSLNSVLAKSLLATCAVMTVMAVSYLTSSSHAMAQNRSEIVIEKSSEGFLATSANPIRLIATKKQGPIQPEDNSDETQLDQMSPGELHRNKSELESARETIESKRQHETYIAEYIEPAISPPLTKSNRKLNHRIDTRVNFITSTGNQSIKKVP